MVCTIVLHINILLTFAHVSPTFQYYHACAHITLHMSEKRKGAGGLSLALATRTIHRQLIATFNKNRHLRYMVFTLSSAFRPHRWPDEEVEAEEEESQGLL